MKLKLSKFTILYKESQRYWYILPRALYFNKNNLEELHKVLSLFKKEQYIKIKDIPSYQLDMFSRLSPEDYILREWDTDAKQKIQKRMIKEGIIKPTAQRRQTLADHLANLRNHINLFKKLGFAFFNKQNHLFISKAGEQFLSSKSNDWEEVLENQIVKLQFWNPSLKQKELIKYKDFRIFPYLFTLKLILSLRRNFISVNEFALFVMPIRTGKEIDKTIFFIENFRSLNQEQQKKVIREANITMPHITNASVTLGMFGCTPTLDFEQNRLKLVDRKRAEYFVNKIYPKMKFVDYVRFEDWFTYIGDTKFEVSNKDIMEYYIDMGEDKKAETVIELTDDIEEKETLKETLDKLLKEKLFEDILEKNPSLLEGGLRLVKNGRQYKTDVSNIDLLTVKDSQYIVVELKKARTEDDVVGQTLRYMGWIRENISKGKLVKGIIVVAEGEITPKLQMAIKGLQVCKDLIIVKELPITVGEMRDAKL
jgi:hypothetical protein